MKMLSLPRIVVLALCCAVAPGALGETKSKTVRDWTGSCDEHSCRAVVTGESGLASGGTGYQLEVARASEAEDGWSVTLIAHNVPQPEKAVTFDVPGHVTRETGVILFGDDRFGLSDQEALEAIFPALRQGNSVTLRFPSARGDAEETFSLSGIAAVLLWIDEAQGRVGKSDNVLAFTDDTANVVAEGERPALKAKLLAASPFKECQSAVEDDTGIPFEPKAYDLGGGYTLYVVQCNMGAYQPSTLMFLSGTEYLEPIPFASYGDETGWGATLWLSEADYDPRTKTVHNFSRFRGIGDCGTWSDFKWTDYGFKLLRYAYKGCSDELPDDNADLGNFPIIYEAK